MVKNKMFSASVPNSAEASEAEVNTDIPTIPLNSAAISAIILSSSNNKKKAGRLGH
jgi:hypothetical protein